MTDDRSARDELQDVMAEIRDLEARLAEARERARPERRRAASSLGARVSWEQTKDRPARTAPARAALDQKFLDEAGGDPMRAKMLRKAHYRELARKSHEARRRNRDADQ